MKVLLILLILSLPNLSLAQKLPAGFTCQDLIDTSEGKVSRSTDGGRTYVPIKRPQPRDAFGVALLSHDTQLCFRLSRGEITVDQFNALHDEKFQKLRGERERVLVERKQLENQQQAIRNQQAAIRAQREALEVQRQTAVIEAVQAEATRQQQGNRQEIYDGENTSNPLIQACGAKGLGVDFVTGNCVSPRGGQINPQNLYQPFAAPLPKPDPSELVMRCGAQGRAADFATGRCM